MRQKDYEALGKYAEAIESVRYAVAERQRLLGSLTRLTSRIAPLSVETGEVGGLDVEAATEILEDLTRREADLDAAIRLANANAIRAGKPYLRKSA